jgi:hypothetical protein
VTSDAQAQQLARIQGALGTYVSLLTTLVTNNPRKDIGEYQHRPDLAHALATGLGTAQEAALHMVTSSWQHADTATRQHLIADVNRAYDGVTPDIHEAVSAAWHSIPDRPFVPGVSVPGTNPAAEVAAQRAQAVREAVARVLRPIALRNALSASVAASASQTEATIDEARQRADATGKTYELVWRSRKIPGVTCAWCWGLDGTVVSPGDEFPHPGQIGARKPPRLWRGVLHGPPLHPNCMCWLEIREALPPSAPRGVGPTEEPPHQYVSSADIRALPEARYQGLVSFMRAALHELALIVRRLIGVGGG